jgi:hypothetical protein
VVQKPKDFAILGNIRRAEGVKLKRPRGFAVTIGVNVILITAVTENVRNFKNLLKR